MGCNLYGATTLSDNSTDGSYAQAPCRKLLNSFPRTLAFQPTHYRPWCRNGLFTQCMRNTCIWAETNLAPIPVVCTCQLQFVFAFSYSLYQPSNFPLVTIQSYCYRYYICPSWLYTFFCIPNLKYGFHNYSDFTKKGGVWAFGHYGRGLINWGFTYSACIFSPLLFSCAFDCKIVITIFPIL